MPWAPQRAVVFAFAIAMVVGMPMRGRGIERPQSVVLAAANIGEASGLLNHVLPIFTGETGIAVVVVTVTSDEVLAGARNGESDLVLTDDPAFEQRFMDDGYGVARRSIASADFVVVGPILDPAHVRGSRDAVAALAAIAASKSPFVASGSAANALERRLWRAARITPPKGNGRWYRAVGGGMAAMLGDAAATDAYALTDRASWLAFAGKRDLVVAVEGDSRLVDRYDVIVVDPKLRPPDKNAAARTLADWLVSPAGQRAIAGYRVAGQPVFHSVPAAPK